MVGGKQSLSINDKTQDHFEKNNVPAHVIAMYQQNDEQDDTESTITVWYQHQLAFLVFYRNAGRWKYINRPAGMGTLSIPNQWDWERAESSMQRMAQVRRLTEQERDELYQQLEVMEYGALKEIKRQFSQIST